MILPTIESIYQKAREKFFYLLYLLFCRDTDVKFSKMF